MLHGIDIRLLYLHVLAEVGSEETLTEIEVETAACHVHTWVEVVGAVGWGGLQTDAEDTEVVEVYRLTFQQQLTQTVLRLNQHATDGRL